MGWITSTRALTTSPALTLDGMRIRTRPMSAAMLASAAPDGDLDLALGLQERPVAHLRHRPHVGALPEPQIGRDVRLPNRRRQGELGVERPAILVGDDVDRLDIALGGLRRVHL